MQPNVRPDNNNIYQNFPADKKSWLLNKQWIEGKTMYYHQDLKTSQLLKAVKAISCFLYVEFGIKEAYDRAIKIFSLYMKLDSNCPKDKSEFIFRRILKDCTPQSTPIKNKRKEKEKKSIKNVLKIRENFYKRTGTYPSTARLIRLAPHGQKTIMKALQACK